MINRKQSYSLYHKQKSASFYRHPIVLSGLIGLLIAGGMYLAPNTMLNSLSLLDTDTLFSDSQASDTHGTADAQGTPTADSPTVAAPASAIPPLLAIETTAVTPDPTLVAMPMARAAGSSAIARFGSKQLYAYTSGDPAARQADAWRTARPADAARMDTLAATPKARWLGDWNGDIHAATSSYVSAARAAGKIPVIVAYNIPNRHCSNEPGGAGDADVYKSWIDGMATALRPYPGIVIVEPDALGLVSCLSAADQDVRYELVRYASKALAGTGSAVYLDASHWVEAEEMANRLKRAGIEYATGFAINVANYNDTASMRAYGDSLSAATTGKHYVIDTGRNGQGSNGEWCNALGRSIGEMPQLFKSGKLDAYLWVKYPGESDGTCNGGPAAGQWWADYALGLLTKAGL